ncbi:MAG: hypothetical protein AB7P01_00330 [Bacteroidia bacterium]
MNTKVLLGALASTVLIFFGGWVVFGMLLMDMMAGEMSHAYDGLMKSPPDLPILAAWQFLWSLMLAIVLDKMGKRSFMDGAMTGALLSFLLFLGYDLSFEAFFIDMYTTKLFVVDVVINTIMWSLACGVIGLILGSGNK